MTELRGFLFHVLLLAPHDVRSFIMIAQFVVDDVVFLKVFWTSR